MLTGLLGSAKYMLVGAGTGDLSPDPRHRGDSGHEVNHSPRLVPNQVDEKPHDSSLGIFEQFMLFESNKI